MVEFALATKLENKNIFDFLQSQVQAKLNFCKNILTGYSDNNFNYLLLACEEGYIEPCENILRETIIDYIESIYKVNYLKNKIKNPLGNSLAFDAYIKVLSVFDKATDESALDKIILFNQTFFVDSFLDFRLTPLKKHWDNLAELSSDNITLFNSHTFLDIIRFLINSMDNVVYKLKVVCKNGKFSVYNMKNKNARVKKIADCHNEVELISSIFNACPSYIDMYLNDNENNEAVSFLSDVYSNRLKIFIKN